ncbi:MAG: response regulator [Chloracidobacterium sp.]|nr:response regulator [Chloracidobacterium sp.]
MDTTNTSERKKILLADDSATIRKVIELTFEDEGIDVYSVADGDAAMKKFVEIEPDLVLADVNMPGMSGYQICEMIKQDESTCDIPVILLTGSFEPFDPGEASRVGSNFYFTKPFISIRDLVSRVKEYLELGAFDNAGPESVDIDELYNQSISESVEPDNDDVIPFGAEIGESTEADSPHEELLVLHEELSSFDPDAVHTIPAITEEMPEPLAVESSNEIESSRSDEFETAMPDNESPEDSAVNITEPVEVADVTDPLDLIEAEQSIGEVDPIIETPGETAREESTDLDLGDAGMDDDMIVAVQPNSHVEAGVHTELDTEIEYSASDNDEVRSVFIDPFETPAAEFESNILKGEPSEDEHQASSQLVEPAGFASSATAVKFALDEDAEHQEHSAGLSPESDLESDAVISEALIEKITERVLARLSDTVVRDVALDAVPKIAEKLIREALAGNQRN